MRRIILVVCVMAALTAVSALHAAELSGVVTGKDGKPAVVQVVIKDSKGMQVGEPVTTDKNGAYAFRDIKPGSYTVVVAGRTEWKIFVGPGETRRDFALK
jgi:hypothetical protein